MPIIYFICGFITCYILFELGKATLIRDSFKRIELQFLLGSLYLLQFKHHALQILEIVYERAAEDDPKYTEEYKQVVNKVQEKFELFGNKWIHDLQEILPYNLEYNNWKNAIEHADKLFNKRK